MFENNTEYEAIKVSNAHIWASSNGTHSSAGLVVQNTGNKPLTIESLMVRGMTVPYSSWYFNTADATQSNVMRELRPDFTLNAVDVTNSAPEETFIQATGPISINQGQAVIIYLANPSGINMMDAGLDYNLNVKAGKSNAAVAAVHVIAS